MMHNVLNERCLSLDRCGGSSSRGENTSEPEGARPLRANHPRLGPSHRLSGFKSIACCGATGRELSRGSGLSAAWLSGSLVGSVSIATEGTVLIGAVSANER